MFTCYFILALLAQVAFHQAAEAEAVLLEKLHSFVSINTSHFEDTSSSEAPRASVTLPLLSGFIGLLLLPDCYCYCYCYLMLPPTATAT